MRKKILFLMIFTLIFLSGCKNNSNKQGDEVILARDCGLEDLMCCSNNPQCFDGLQCCVNTLDSTDTYCGIDCQCGEDNSFCCANDVCNDGLSCQNNRCLACGKTNEPCCDKGDKCVDNLVCYEGLCSECGKDKQPCCSDDFCVDNNRIGDNLECVSGLCRNCGFDGFNSCIDGQKCFSGQINSNGVCYRCGGANQPCCNESSAVDYECRSEENLVCNLGFCIEKKD